MCKPMYLESALRDKLGVADSLIKKTRRELVAVLTEDPTRKVKIEGRHYTAYPESFVRSMVEALSKKDGRGASAAVAQENALCAESMAALLEAALIQGNTEEIDGVLQSTEVTLTVVKVQTKKRTRLEVEHPERPGERATLLVKDTRLYGVGMMIPGCRKIASGVYEYAGRQPRSRKDRRFQHAAGKGRNG